MRSMTGKIASLVLSAFWIFFSGAAIAQPVLSVSVSPNRSRNGESVLFKIKVQTDSSGRMTAPALPALKDWELVNSFRSESPSVSYTNGKVQYRFRGEYSYFLRPLRSGQLSIPQIDVQVGNNKYKTDPLSVQVDSLPQGQASRPSRGFQAPTRQAPLPPQFQTGPALGDEEEDYRYGTGSVGLSPSDVPARETFFIRPEHKVKEAYVGQMIELSYVLYQRTRALRNFEMAKFPDFKGFLKEELFITKNFTQERVQIGNEVFLRSEIIRYALFPLKSGALKIEPFVVRGEVFTSPEDLINSLITGAPAPQMGTPIPMEKSSGSITIPVKELPPSPEGAIFTGAVGNFNIELKAPEGQLSVDQPFTVQFTIAGKGNVKMIEEAPLPLPEGLELYQTKNTSELRPDTSGYKNFEYLLLPRKNGSLTLEPIKWAYFDPEARSYSVLETPRLIFQVEGTPGAGSSNSAPIAKAPERRISPFDGVQRALIKRETAPSSALQPLWIGIWTALSMAYIALGLAFFRRRQAARRLAHLKDNPWEKTALSIHNKNYKSPVGLTILVDQWTREYLTGHLKTPELHPESPRSEFERVIARRLPPEFMKHGSDLTEFWRQLDLARFAGSEKWPLEIKPNQIFSAAQEVTKKIISRCRFEDEALDEEDDD